MTPKEIPVDRFRIFGRDGSAKAEFITKAERSYAIGDESRLQFTYASRKTDIVNDDVLNFGNWVLVENTYLPPWVGVIDTPRTSSARIVTVSCYSPERVFSWRRGPTEVVKNGSAGALFRYMLSLVNTAEPTIITTGNIDETGTRRQETFNPTALSVDLERLYERSQEEYQFRPVVNDTGRLVVYADWMPRLGIDTTVLLHEGKEGGNVEVNNNLLVEDGFIANDVLGYGDGVTWLSRPKVNITNGASIFKYGLRQKSEGFDGVTSPQTLKDNTDEFVHLNKRPIRTFSVNAINVGDTFSFMGLGNTMTLQLQNAGLYEGGTGLQTTVRITGMHYNPDSKNKISLVLEELVSIE